MILKLLLNTQIIWMIFIKNIGEHNPNKERKMLIVFHGLISDMLINKKLNPIVNELVITGRKLNISPILLHNPILLYQKILH